MVKLKIEGETKEEKFKRIASLRTQKILECIRLLGNCANKSNYNYTDNDVVKIFNVIDTKLKEIKYKFKNHKSKRFTL